MTTTSTATSDAGLAAFTADFRSTYALRGDKVVKAYRIIGSRLIVFEAWEPINDHRTITTAGLEGLPPTTRQLGLIASRPLDSNVYALEVGSPERQAQVGASYRRHAEVAHATIYACYPFLADLAAARKALQSAYGSIQVGLDDILDVARSATLNL